MFLELAAAKHHAADQLSHAAAAQAALQQAKQYLFAIKAKAAVRPMIYIVER